MAIRFVKWKDGVAISWDFPFGKRPEFTEENSVAATEEEYLADRSGGVFACFGKEDEIEHKRLLTKKHAKSGLDLTKYGYPPA